jgi:hypothetical protein
MRCDLGPRQLLGECRKSTRFTNIQSAHSEEIQITMKSLINLEWILTHFRRIENAQRDWLGNLGDASDVCEASALASEYSES